MSEISNDFLTTHLIAAFLSTAINIPIVIIDFILLKKLSHKLHNTKTEQNLFKANFILTCITAAIFAMIFFFMLATIQSSGNVPFSHSAHKLVNMIIETVFALFFWKHSIFSYNLQKGIIIAHLISRLFVVIISFFASNPLIT